MFEFIEEMIFTGKAKKTSKNGNEYTLISYLGEDGQTFTTIAECILPELNQLDKVRVKFKVTPGRYLTLKTIGIEKI